jgi:predicted enzyme related to lactoylglutathione lyase
MPHPVMYFEIGCRDVAATRDFYKSLFDWEMNEDKPNYVGLPKGAPHGIGGHIMALGHEPHQYTLVLRRSRGHRGVLREGHWAGRKGDRPSGGYR